MSSMEREGLSLQMLDEKLPSSAFGEEFKP
jgi:hypothetical protein